MPGIFINYRRDDQAGFAGRLADVLENAFGVENVFRDVEDIHPGEDFVVAIQKQLSSVSVMLVMIGPAWLTVNNNGVRRLDETDDFVRREIQAALESWKPVLPVLVGGALMPEKADLPNEISALALRQAFVLSDASWDSDVARLVEFIRPLLPAQRRSQLRRVVALIAGADAALRGELDRVCVISARLSWELASTPEQVRTALKAAQLHDIGKIYLPRELLDKAGELSPGERAIIETHATRGAQLAQRLGYPADVCTAIRQHHERWDGTGYPAGLGEAGIDRIASVVAVADTYDALVSERPYKRAWTREEALDEVQRQADSHFAPDVVVALHRAVAPVAPIPIRGRVKMQRAA